MPISYDILQPPESKPTMQKLAAPSGTDTSGSESLLKGLGALANSIKGALHSGDNNPLNNITNSKTGSQALGTPYPSDSPTLDNSKGMLGGQIPGAYGTGTYSNILNNRLDPNAIAGASLHDTPNLYPDSDMNELNKTPAFQTAYAAHKEAENAGLTTSPNVTIVDFSKPADSKRLWVVDTDKNQILMNTQVAQGSTPGFSNNPNSHQSSLGTFRTNEVYNSQKVGYAERLEGLEPGVNDKAFARGILIHGGQYVGPDRAGTSWGCFAVSNDMAPSLIGLTKGGTIVHAYAPDAPAMQNFASSLTATGQERLSNTLGPDGKQTPVYTAVQASKKAYPDNPVMSGIAASQAILESNLADKPSGLARNSNNYFGIKGKGTAGSTVLPTHEYVNGRMITTNAGFAKNATPEDSYKQHAALMQNPRYKGVLESKTVEQAAVELQKAGYATDPHYAKELIQIYNKYVKPLSLGSPANGNQPIGKDSGSTVPSDAKPVPYAPGLPPLQEASASRFDREPTDDETLDLFGDSQDRMLQDKMPYTSRPNNDKTVDPDQLDNVWTHPEQDYRTNNLETKSALNNINYHILQKKREVA